MLYTGGLQSNFDRLGFFNVHLNLSTRVFFAFHPHLNAAAVAAIRSHIEFSKSTPKPLSYHDGLHPSVMTTAEAWSTSKLS